VTRPCPDAAALRLAFTRTEGVPCARAMSPPSTNGSENDIRCQVTRRKVSAGTRSDIGRNCRDAFLSLAKTCDKLGIAIWDYLGSRFKVAGHSIIEPLDYYVRALLRPA
jgi:hypothetical protein